MNEQKIVQVVHIKSTIQSVWDALTKPEITSAYWGNTRIESDWQLGSKILYLRDGEVTDEHIILEIEAPQLLVHSFKPLFGDFQYEKPSRVTIRLQQLDDTIRLDLIHDDFQDNSKVYLACCEGWPKILGGLKLLLESGSALR